MVCKRILVQGIFVGSVSLLVGQVCAMPATQEQEHIQASATPENNQSAASSGHDTDDKDVINNLLQGLMTGDQSADGQDFSKILTEIWQAQYQEKIKDEIEKRSRLLQVLPEPLREQITAVGKEYQDFAQSLKLEKRLAVLCQKVRADLDVCTFEQASFKNEMQTSLEALYRALNDGSFTRLAQPPQLPGSVLDIQGFMTQMLGQMAQASQAGPSLSRESLKKIIEQLATLNDVLAHDGQLRNHSGLCDTTSALLTLLQLVEQKDTKKLSRLCVDLVRPDYVALSQKIKDLIGLISDAHIQCNQETDPFLKEALEHWLEQIKGYKRTLSAFFSLASSSNFDFSSFLLKAASNIYEVVVVVFDARRFNAFNLFNPADYAFRAVIGSLAYVHRSNEAAAQEIGKYVLGNGDLSQCTKSSIEDKLMSAISVMAMAVLNPTQFADRLGWKKIIALRVLFAYSYYQYLKKTNPSSVGKLGESYYMRLVLSTLVRDVQHISQGLLKQTIRSNVDPEALEVIEDASLGLIKPELIDLAFDIAVPYLLSNNSFLKDNNIVAFELHDFLRYESFFKEMKSYHTPAANKFWWMRLFMPSPLVDASLSKEAQEKRAAEVQKKLANGEYSDEYLNFFIKYRLLSYCLGNLGNFGGKKVAHAFDGKVARLAYSAFKNSINFLDRTFISTDDDDDTAIVTQQDKIEDMLSMLKSILVLILQTESGERTTVINFLKSSGWIAENVTEPLKINDSIVSRFLMLLQDNRVCSHQQIRDLYEAYFEHRENLAPFLDILVERLKENLAATACGWAGCAIGKIAAYYIAWNKMAPTTRVV